MSSTAPAHPAVVHTVLGPVPVTELGVVSVHEALLSVVPGAQYAFDITIDRAEVFETLKAQLEAFRAAGGGTIVDATGMFHGRDVRLYENLARATGVHIVASTGMGPEENLGGYFLTPQTNPPTPWPAEKFAELFTAEVTDGMVVPRVERRATAGLVVALASEDGMTPTDESLLRGAARAAQQAGRALTIVAPADPLAALGIALSEGLDAGAVILAGVDRADAAGVALTAAGRGARVAIDHVGWDAVGGYLADAERIALITELIAAGFADRILLSASAVGVAKGHPAAPVDYTTVLTAFVPRLRAHGITEDDIQRILVANPRDVLAGRDVRAGEGN